ncbi:MAG TPA: 50S ribosomal protein L29 [Sphingomicrobium sp.]|nr:50S ribosomal protein L29 [Sphingomicrobium sp.]
MGAEELRMKTEDQLKGDLANLKKEAFNLRFQQANGQLENTARVRAVRRDIARIMTFLGQKASAAAASAPAPKAEARPAKPKAKKAAKPKAEAGAKKAAQKPKTTTPKAKKAAAKKTAKAKA